MQTSRSLTFLFSLLLTPLSFADPCNDIAGNWTGRMAGGPIYAQIAKLNNAVQLEVFSYQSNRRKLFEVHGSCKDAIMDFPDFPGGNLHGSASASLIMLRAGASFIELKKVA